MYYDELIKKAFAEDFNKLGDVTSSAIFGEEKDKFILFSKQNGILAGREIFCRTFQLLDENSEIDFLKQDGAAIQKNERIASIYGKIQSILEAERTALNFLSHLSGIATQTNLFVKNTAGTTKILDTRKTLPGLRELQKYAVICGGGNNHRMGLFDLVMIKDNHIDAAGGIEAAVKKVRNKWENKFKIEVEVRNLEEVKIALQLKVDRIMLDNMSLEKMQKAVHLIGGRVEVEASGNMSLDRIQEVSQTGVDFISVGSLTHSVKAFDFSLRSKEQI